MALPVVRGKIKLGKAKIHDYVLPKAIVYLLGSFGGILLIAGLILALVGIQHSTGILQPWGFVLLGLGWCLMLISMLLCCHAFCIKPTRSNPYYIKTEEPRVVVVKDKKSKKSKLKVVSSQNQPHGVVTQGQTNATPMIVLPPTSTGTTPEYEYLTLRRDVSGGEWSSASRPTSAVAEKDFDFQYYSANQVHDPYGQQSNQKSQQVIFGHQTPQQQSLSVGLPAHGGSQTLLSSQKKEFYVPQAASPRFGMQSGISNQNISNTSSGQKVFVFQQSPALQRSDRSTSEQGFIIPGSPAQQHTTMSNSGHIIPDTAVQHQRQNSGGLFQPFPPSPQTYQKFDEQSFYMQQQDSTPGIVLYKPPAGNIQRGTTSTHTEATSSSYVDGGKRYHHRPMASDQPLVIDTMEFNPQPQRATTLQLQGQDGSHHNEYSYSYSYQHGDNNQSANSVVSHSNVEAPRRGSLYDN